MYFKSHYVQVFWSKFFTVAVKAKSVSMRPFWVLTTYQRCKYIFWMSGFSKTCCMEPLHSFFWVFFLCFKKRLHRLQFFRRMLRCLFCCETFTVEGDGGWREGNRERWWGSTVCRQHLLHSERPLSPPLSHNPLLPVNTTEERSHTRQQVTLPWLITIPHVCSHTR